MVDTVNVRRAPSDEREQICLASGEVVAMRLRRDLPEGQLKPPSRRTYETVGFVVSGRALLQLERRMIHLRKGDCWIVPAGAEHAYIIQEPLTAIEATSPPARALGRDGA
jgi:mannose-6-phosphate isomerase-like protein (cupin superfamily)